MEDMEDMENFLVKGFDDISSGLRKRSPQLEKEEEKDNLELKSLLSSKKKSSREPSKLESSKSEKEEKNEQQLYIFPSIDEEINKASDLGKLGSERKEKDERQLLSSFFNSNKKEYNIDKCDQVQEEKININGLDVTIKREKKQPNDLWALILMRLMKNGLTIQH